MLLQGVDEDANLENNRLVKNVFFDLVTKCLQIGCWRVFGKIGAKSTVFMTGLQAQIPLTYAPRAGGADPIRGRRS